jgi:hypothetical protein
MGGLKERRERDRDRERGGGGGEEGKWQMLVCYVSRPAMLVSTC